MYRPFHSSRELCRKAPESYLDIRARKKKNLAKRIKGPPVNTPYVPLPIARANKSLRDRTVDIFEGMTIVELSKRTGETIPYLQQILANIGESFDSEFEPISIDIAELIAMVC